MIQVMEICAQCGEELLPEEVENHVCKLDSLKFFDAFDNNIGSYLAKSQQTKKYIDDFVNHPKHYTNIASCPKCGASIEAIDITEKFNFCVGNALKYILRAGKKDSYKQDLQKAVWYLNREIDSIN